MYDDVTRVEKDLIAHTKNAAQKIFVIGI